MSKAVIQPFEEYQKSRVMFVQTVAELAKRKANIEPLKKVGVMRLLSPLLSDPVTSIKQSAALAISRLAKEDNEMAKAVVEDKGMILLQLLESIESKDKYFKSAACLVIKAVAKHSTLLAEILEEKRAISFLVECLREYDPTVKHAAIAALGEIARHNQFLAKKVVDEGAIDPLITCTQEPEIVLKRVAVQTLCKIVRHSEELTNAVNRGDNLNILNIQLVNHDTLLKRQILLCLGYMTKHSSSVGVMIVSHENFKEIENCIQHNPDPTVQKNGLVLLNEIAKKNKDNPMNIAGKIKPKVFINYLRDHRGEPRLFCIPILSTMAGFNRELADTIFAEGGLIPFIDVLDNEHNPNIVSLACLAISNMARHAPDLTNKLVLTEHGDGTQVMNNLQIKLLHKAVDNHLPHELKENAKAALESIIENCSEIDILSTLLDVPRIHSLDKHAYGSIICKAIRKQRGILQEQRDKRKEFFKKRVLKKIFDLKKEFEGVKMELDQFNDIYSNEMMNYFSDDHEERIKRECIANLDKL